MSSNSQASIRASSREEALQSTIDAAEASMRALKLVEDPKDKARHSARFKQLLQEAERIKHCEDWRSTPARSSASQPATKIPASTRNPSRAEQILLLKASYLNNLKFPPWTTPPAPDEFDLADGESLFVDAPELCLSEVQEEAFDGWKRPHEALPPPLWSFGGVAKQGPSMSFVRSIDLVQDAATDCSLVASLCAGVARAERGHSKILRTVIYPYDEENRRPIMSRNGKYFVRLNFNGCFRKIVIDDRLPVSSAGRVIHVVDRHNPGLLWPALIEKAYLKVLGGYDFPGSNSATDLWVLTGWIPEQVFLQSDDLEPERFWRHTLEAFDLGDVLITMGTGKMTPETERDLGLAGEHDYAVLDLREVEGQKLFLIKNPWCEGASWCGKTQIPPHAVMPDRELSELASIESDEDTASMQCSRDLLNADKELSPGTFWMDIDNVLQHFESIYLNWNPGIFSQRQDVHFTWNLGDQKDGRQQHRGQFASLSRHPQFTATASKGGTIWVLLSRHLRNAIPTGATEQKVAEGRHTIDLQGHIALAAFSSQGQRVLLPEKHILKGWFVDSPQTLIKLRDCVPGSVYTIVPLEQDLVAAEQTFTLSVFGNSPLTLAEAAPRAPCTSVVPAAWTKETAGGNAHSPTYPSNPQFSVAVLQKTDMRLMVEAASENASVHVKLVYSKGQRVQEIRNRDIIFDSGEYRKRCCVAEFAELETGHYTIICSTFEPNQLGAFTLTVESSQPVRTTAWPKEGAGRLRMELSTAIIGVGNGKIAARLIPKRLVNFYAIASQLDSASTRASGNSSLLRMSIESGRGPMRRIYTASNGGEYADCIGGVRTGGLDLAPETLRHGEQLWFVLDRMCTSTDAREEGFGVVLFLDQPDALACGAWRTWDD
ncbi:cysteine protease [Friedmanniomyces endolithicus]|nr:cysteine protease [Friedmanniomyces endolithicus]KAK0829855.1 cysteine protease [Friedmanniomyces endolithicus]